VGAAVRADGANRLDRSADKPETLVAAEFMAFINEHLHPQANAEQWLPSSGMFDDRPIQPSSCQFLHSARKSAHSGKHDAIMGRELLIGRDHINLASTMFDCTPDTIDIAYPVVDYRNSHVTVRVR
jgi:hypothetical protein